MKWNWQRADWPDFSWQQSRLARAEEQFLIGGGVFLGAVSHLGTTDNDQLTVDALSFEAVTTSEIEARSSTERACNPRSNGNWAWRATGGASERRSMGSPR